MAKSIESIETDVKQDTMRNLIEQIYSVVEKERTESDILELIATAAPKDVLQIIETTQDGQDQDGQDLQESVLSTALSAALECNLRQVAQSILGLTVDMALEQRHELYVLALEMCVSILVEEPSNLASFVRTLLDFDRSCNTSVFTSEDLASAAAQIASNGIRRDELFTLLIERKDSDQPEAEYIICISDLAQILEERNCKLQYQGQIRELLMSRNPELKILYDRANDDESTKDDVVATLTDEHGLFCFSTFTANEFLLGEAGIKGHYMDMDSL